MRRSEGISSVCAPQQSTNIQGGLSFVRAEQSSFEGRSDKKECSSAFHGLTALKNKLWVNDTQGSINDSPLRSPVRQNASTNTDQKGSARTRPRENERLDFQNQRDYLEHHSLPQTEEVIEVCDQDSQNMHRSSRQGGHVDRGNVNLAK